VLASDGVCMSAFMPLYSFKPDSVEHQRTDRSKPAEAQLSANVRTAETDSGVCPETFGGAHPFRPTACPSAPMQRRVWLAGLGAAGLASFFPRHAYAGSFASISLDELVRTSNHVIVGTPRVGDCVWETVGESRRIVTYTRLTVDEVLDDRDPADGEVLLRTLGGQVGAFGQVVQGEAEIQRDQVCVVFLKARSDGTFRVTGLAQGHYPLIHDAQGTRRLVPGSSHVEVFTRDVSSAVGRLQKQSIPDARRLVQEIRHAK
jgi:hypothetical protein